MSKYLLVDFGSTFTKLTVVDTEKEDVIAASSHFTTVATDITVGFEKALSEIYRQIPYSVQFERVLACSSAAGGLKMASVGLVEELTAEAAKRACLGAGAKVDLVFSHYLTDAEIDLIKSKKIDIILLAGGTDGGNSECVLFNCRKLGEKHIGIPVIFAGNKCCRDEISKIFEAYEMDGYFSDNVMPKLNVLNLTSECSARDKIREIFLEKIIEAKGIKKIEKKIGKVIRPTPEAVLTAAELLSEGYLHEPGLGELAVIDVGGATTDFYSMSSPGAKRGGVIIKGLGEPYAKRTVEGDLGIRYSAPGIAEQLTAEEKAMLKEDKGIDIDKETEYRRLHVDAVFTDEKEQEIDTVLAGICCHKAVSRHAGTMEEIYTPMGMFCYQKGKDLSEICYVIGTGGVLIHNRNPLAAMKEVLATERCPLELRPVKPKFLLDADYLLSAMGLLSDIDPLIALKIMKKHLKEIFPKRV